MRVAVSFFRPSGAQSTTGAAPRRRIGRTALLACALALASGCGLPERARPLPDSTLVAVLTDLHLARARTLLYADLPPGARDSIFARHSVDTLAFRRSLERYAARPDRMSALQDSITTHLLELQARLREEPPPTAP